ncbi:MAG: lecithin retinol acyltransferase family protein [Rhodospirillales bacterium]|nr:lecithin retinol acyltransferase family protein [Rhodospirillales bacterium]
MSIYVSCYDERSVGNSRAARRALSMIGRRRNYNLLLDNCHQFVAGCLTGDFENSDNFLWMLKDTASNVLGSNTWRIWNLSNEELFG